MQQKYLNKTDSMENLLVKFPKSMIAQMDKRVQTGAYGSRAELIREAMRRLLGENR